MSNIAPGCKSEWSIEAKYNEMKATLKHFNNQITHLEEENNSLKKMSTHWEDVSHRLNVFQQFMHSHMTVCAADLGITTWNVPYTFCYVDRATQKPWWNGCNADTELSTTMRMLSMEPIIGKSEQLAQAEYNEMKVVLEEKYNQMGHLAGENFILKEKAAYWDDASQKLIVFEQFMHSHLASCSGASASVPREKGIGDEEEEEEEEEDEDEDIDED